MAPRASWKGHLKLSLVSCPVRLYNATSGSERIAFNLLHKDTHNRIQMKPHDPELGPVERSDLVKGYEYEKDQYVVFTDEDFAEVQVDSSQAIVIEKFVDLAEVDQLYLDVPYYLAPDGAVAEETFRVIQLAMTQKGKAALARVVLSGRERLIAMAPRGKGLMMMTLRNASEVRDHGPVFDTIGEGEAEPDMLQLAAQLIDQKTGSFDPSEFTDRYQEAVVAMVKAKIQGQAPVIAKAPERGKVINLMDALRQSLEAAGKPPAKSRPRAAAPQPGKGTAQRAPTQAAKPPMTQATAKPQPGKGTAQRAPTQAAKPPMTQATAKPPVAQGAAKVAAKATPTRVGASKAAGPGGRRQRQAKAS